MKTKVLALLKPKVVALGFTTEELEGVAADLAGNLKDDATDEQINLVVNAAIPSLKLSQQAVNRIVNAEKEKARIQQEKESKEKAEREEAERLAKEAKDKEGKGGEEVPAWAKAILDQNKALTEQVQTLSGSRLSEQRTATFQKALDGLSEKNKSNELAMFSRIVSTFSDDADFDSFMEEKKIVFDELKQEEANVGLRGGRPGGGASTPTGEATDAEVSSVVDNIKF